MFSIFLWVLKLLVSAEIETGIGLCEGRCSGCIEVYSMSELIG